MWTDVLQIIYRLTAGPDLSVAGVGAALKADLAPALDTPQARHYRAELPSGPIRDVELRVIPPTGVSVLVLRANPDKPVVIPEGDLRRFGPPKWRSNEPKSPPEGAIAECFDVGGFELRVGYRADSRQLEVVSVGIKGDPA